MSDTIRKYLIDTFCDKLQMEAKRQELDKREVRIVKVEASQRIINGKLVEDITKEMEE